MERVSFVIAACVYDFYLILTFKLIWHNFNSNYNSSSLRHYTCVALIADEMGLGKTIQVRSASAYLVGT